MKTSFDEKGNEKMARLPEAVEIMNASLTKAYAELEWIGGKLEEECIQAHEADGAPHILSLVQRIHKLKAEVPTLWEQCKETISLKNECVHAIELQMKSNAARLEEVQKLAGLDPLVENESLGNAMNEMSSLVQQCDAAHDNFMEAGT